MWYEVLTSSVGSVYAGSDKAIGLEEFKFQCQDDKQHNVVLLANGKVLKERFGKMGCTPEWLEMVQKLTQGGE